MKRVLLLVVDGCTSRILGPAIEAGEMPVLAGLAARGSLALDCVSVFPSITPAATASIVTGAYPARHGIVGMSWWNADNGDVSYFGDDVETVLRRGIGDFLRGFLLRLNGERLQAPTLFELAERHGKRAACFNHLIFRGDVPHEVSPPLLLKLLPSVSSGLVAYGPSWLCLGDFVSHAGERHDVGTTGGVFHRFGFDDAGTERFLRSIPSAAALPDLSVAYFADYDFDSHSHGLEHSRTTLLRLDRRLGNIFDTWGGIDRVLDETCIILTADHSHSDVESGTRAAIDLTGLLDGHRCADPSTGWRDGDDLMVCPNMRAAEIFLRHPDVERVARVCRAVLQDERVDQVIWREPGEADQLHVTTKDRGSLRFRRAPARTRGVRDDYGGGWELQGDAGALDLSITGGEVRCGVYPNALERLERGVDHPRGGRLWITARPGAEFRMQGQSVHARAGSHGTLHELDSIVPLLVAGGPADEVGAATLRIIDAAAVAAAYLEIPFATRPGESHA